MPVTEETDLQATGKWDSLAVVVTVGAIDQATGAVVDGVALGRCQIAADVLILAGLVP
jgi:acyl carrier protein